jgi:hypothetical protein
MMSNRIPSVIVATAALVLPTACMTRGAGSDEPPCCDAAASDAESAWDGAGHETAIKLPPPQRAPLGAACVGSADCASGFCADGVCCDMSCDVPCYACNLASSLGTCAGLDGSEDVSASVPCTGAHVCAVHTAGAASCKLREGEACADSAECAGGACRGYFPDADGDGYGANGSSTALSRCDAAPNPPSGFVERAGDCCDTDPGAHPSVVSYSTSRDRCASYDWNCSGGEERPGGQTCASAGGQVLACGQACSLVFKGTVSTVYVQACR